MQRQWLTCSDGPFNEVNILTNSLYLFSLLVFSRSCGTKRVMHAQLASDSPPATDCCGDMLCNRTEPVAAAGRGFAPCSRSLCASATRAHDLHDQPLSWKVFAAHRERQKAEAPRHGEFQCGQRSSGEAATTQAAVAFVCGFKEHCRVSHDMAVTLSTGNCPFAVSPESITVSAPSNTAFITSLTLS